MVGQALWSPLFWDRCYLLCSPQQAPDFPLARDPSPLLVRAKLLEQLSTSLGQQQEVEIQKWSTDSVESMCAGMGDLLSLTSGKVWDSPYNNLGEPPLNQNLISMRHCHWMPGWCLMVMRNETVDRQRKVWEILFKRYKSTKVKDIKSISC